MRLKLFVLLLLAAFIPALAQTATVTGVVINSKSGSPVSGAKVMLRTQGLIVSTGFNGDFRFTDVTTGNDYLLVTCDDYSSAGMDVTIAPGNNDLGTVRIEPVATKDDFYGDADDLLFDEAVMDDEEGSSQNVAALTGANDDIYYSTASYNFSPMYFNYRGYDSQYQAVYLNGVKFNDLIRGRFNFSSLMGMTSRAFRNKTTTVGLNAANYGFGDIGGSTNYNTITDLYAPGFNGSAAYTNANYMLRGMVTYSSGVNRHGWAYTISGIARWANEGEIDGTFYNSGGLFISAEKVFNENNSLTLTAFGGPTQRATAGATYQEVYDLTGNNLYNPYWGWQEGKKRSSRITETFDPTVMLTYLYKKDRTQVNTSAALRWVNYQRSALQYYKANDPNPTYYRYLPSYYLKDGQPTKESEYYTYLWQNDDSFRQINWDNLYQINYLNNIQNENLPDEQHKGSSYILENRVNNQFNFLLNAYVNSHLTDWLSLQAGVDMNYTESMNYKTVRDLMGGEFWLDIDPFSDRDITLKPDNLQNDLDHPNRRVKKGDKFGYNYDIIAFQANLWLQNAITLPHWDINYGMKVSYTQFQRNGHMRNGRAPQNSLGVGNVLHFDNAAFKVGATHKFNGRNQVSAHLEYGSRAPLADNVYIAPRVKDTTIENPSSQRDFSIDLNYIWNYRRFRGTFSMYYTQMDNAVERTGFYDDRYNTYAIFALQGVKRAYKGVELGMAYKITTSLTATFAGTFARFQYKNNPMGTRSFENGLYDDVSQIIYLRNYYIGSTPQTQANLALDYAAPKNWFFNINATYQGDAYVNLSPAYHEALPDLWEKYSTEAELEAKIAELSGQDKLKDAFTLNLSVGKAIYLRKVALNFNLNVYNVLNNRDIVTYAYQQGRLDTTNYIRDKYPNRYQYAQGIRIFFNFGIRF